jgi:hypothetical protein
MPITTLAIEPEDIEATLVPSATTPATITETTSPSVEIHDSADIGVGEDTQQSKSTRDQSPGESGDTMPKHMAGPGQIAQTTKTVQRRSKHVSFSGLSARAHDDASKDECNTCPRTIDFEELVKIAAASKSRPSEGYSMDKHPEGGEQPHKLPNVTSSAKDVIDSYPSLENTKETRGPSPGVSTDRGRPNTQRSLPQMDLSRPGTREKPIVINDMSDDDHRKTDQRDPGSHLDLMQHALRRVTQRDTRDEDVQMTEDPWPNQRRSPRRSRNTVQRPGLVNWKVKVDGLLDEITDAWTNVQCVWMELYSLSSMKQGKSGQRFQERMCKLEKESRTQRICAADAHKLERAWSLTESIVYPRTEPASDKKLMKRFGRVLRRFLKASEVLDDGDITIGMDLEEEDERDRDWTPNVERKGIQ